MDSSAPVQDKDYWSTVLAQLKKSKLGLLGLAMILFLFVVAVFAPFLANDIPLRIDTSKDLQWLGKTIIPAGTAWPLFRAMTQIDWLMLLGFVDCLVFLPFFLRMRCREFTFQTCPQLASRENLASTKPAPLGHHLTDPGHRSGSERCAAADGEEIHVAVAVDLAVVDAPVSVRNGERRRHPFPEQGLEILIGRLPERGRQCKRESVITDAAV